MATVRIDSGNPEYSDKPHQWPQNKWDALLFQKKYFLKHHIAHDCRCILEFLEDAEVMWEPLGFESKDDLITSGYELDPQEVALAVKWLQIKDPEFEIPFQMAVDEGRKLVQDARENPLNDHGNGPGRGNKRVDNINSFNEPKGGTSKAYLLRRLSRDNPEMLDRIESGELTTRQAAIQSGIIKVKTPFEMVMALVKKLSAEELMLIESEIQTLKFNI